MNTIGLAACFVAGLSACTPLLDLEGQPPTLVVDGRDGLPDREGPDARGAVVNDAIVDGGPEGADGGVAAGDSRVGGQPPPDSTPGADDAAPPDAASGADGAVECVPGEDLGPCAECGPGGERMPLEDDARCPLECPPDHRITEGGACERADTVIPRRCLARGECDDDADRACLYGDYRVIVQPPADACRRVGGCEGPGPPEVAVAPGAECNRFGRCDRAGTCDVPEACAFPDQGLTLCGFGVEMDGTLACRFQLDPGLGPVRCDAFCARNGAVCLLAALAFQRCDTSQPQDCEDSLSPAVCVCGFR